MEIRDVNVEDLDHIAGLARKVWYAHFINIISEEQIDYMLAHGYTSDQMRHDIESGNAVYLKLIHEDQIIGFAAFGPAGEPGLLSMHKLYIHPAYQRLGYGSALMSHIEIRARREGYKAIILAVSRFNEAAVAAYQKQGYKVIQTKVEDIGEGFIIEDHIMQKSLEYAS